MSVTPPTIKLTQSDETLRSAFLGLANPSDVATLLEVELKTLSFYAFKKENYDHFFLKKASGAYRRISVPVTPLKIIQRKLKQILYAVYGSRSVVHGFAKGKSIRSNAARHLGAEWILNFDLEDFFPSIHFGRVLGLFEGKPHNLPQPVAVLLARICCHDGALPIGAPTSPIVANMICAKMDSEIKALAWSGSCIYTRYADDISISTKSSTFDIKIAERNPTTKRWEIGQHLRQLVEGNGFKINPAKTRVRGRRSSMEVTGVRINSRLNIDRRFSRQVKSMLHAWEKFGEEASNKEYSSRYAKKQRAAGTPAFRSVLRGKIEFIGFIRGRDDRLYTRFLQRFQRLSGSHAKPIMIGTATHESVMRQAVWLLRDKDEKNQGTAFALAGNRLFTAAHNMDHLMWASRPGYDSNQYFVQVVKRSDEFDIAEVKIDTFLPVQFEFSALDEISLMKSVCIAGFPKYQDHDSVAFRFGAVVQEREYFAPQDANPSNFVFVRHYVIDADIVKGNSGGPVLDQQNRVIGIAVRGLDIPGRYGNDDQLSSFIPIPLLFKK